MQQILVFVLNKQYRVAALPDIWSLAENMEIGTLKWKTYPAMAEIKTKQTNADVHEFINSFADSEQKKKDSFELLKLMQNFTGHEPKMWGPSIIGFGKYHYKSERSRQEGDWPLVGFSPRKSAISLYVYTGSVAHEHLLKDLGKFKMGKACIYIKRLSDIDQDVLKELMKGTIDFLHSKYGNNN